MANDERPEQFDEDELIRQLVTDPGNVPRFQVLRGFLGKSARDGYIRLYVSPALDQYIEISTKDVLHLKKVSDAESPASGTILWVKSDAQVDVTRTQVRTVQASFLEGPLTAGMRGSAAPPEFAHGAVGERLAVTDWFCTSGEQSIWCTQAWYKDCTDTTYRRLPQHVTEHVPCRRPCWFTQ